MRTGRHRIVSLIPSGTEIVAALGFAQDLAGRSHECDFPPRVDRLPSCSRTKIATRASSRSIDRQVRAIVERALSVYEVDAERLDRLAPTVIVTQTQCELCAVGLADVEAAVRGMVRSQPLIVALEPMRLDDLWRDIRTVAGALDAVDRGDALVRSLQARLDAIRVRSAGLGSRPSVGCIEWIDPLMYAGNWMAELVRIAGGRMAFGDRGAHAGELDFERLAAADPDVLVAMPCGFDIARTVQDMPTLAAHPTWRRLRAVRRGRVFATDGNHYFNRPGPRLVESAEILAELLHPDAFDFGHRGSGWVSWAGGRVAGADALPGGSRLRQVPV